MKGLIGILIFAVAIGSALWVNNWAKGRRTAIPSHSLGWFTFGAVCAVAIVIIVILDKLGLYPR